MPPPDADLTIGKTVGQRLYVHVSALPLASQQFIDATKEATHLCGIAEHAFNVARANSEAGTISLLHYPTFFDDPFPPLGESWKVSLASGDVCYRTYSQSLNPPILHRKELLLSPNDERRSAFEQLTAQLEAVGLFDDPVRIGFRLQWERLLAERGFRVIGHELVPIGNDESDDGNAGTSAAEGSVARHLTALTRYSLSAPLQLLHRHGFLNGNVRFFDYGCGKGDDLRGVKDAGLEAGGWDPYYAADNPVTEADIVNLGFVINVIEDPVERRQALQRAFELAQRVLAVSVMIATENVVRGMPFADGILTGRNTFQKYYTQSEFRQYLESILGDAPILVAPGIAFIFKDKDEEQRFQVARFRSPVRAQPIPRPPRAQREVRIHAAPRLPRSDRYEQHRTLLESLWKICLDLGREPLPEEVPELEAIETIFGSIRRAVRLLRSHHDEQLLIAARTQRADDLRVYFALQHFQKKQPYKHLEPRLQCDVKAFFDSYANARGEGLQLLHQASQTSVLEDAAKDAFEQGLGWLEPGSHLQLHGQLIPRLPPVLRAYVGCAAALYGDISTVDLIKIHLGSGKLSLMTFDDFEGSPLSRMTRRVKVNLRTQDVSIFEYGAEYEPPFVYMKSRFMNEEAEHYAEQLAFDESIQSLRLFDFSGFGPQPTEFLTTLREAHWSINGYRLERLHFFPDLDAACGRYLTYRQLIECGEAQKHTGLPNRPTQAASYTALYDLAVNILDPIIEYFGQIELTYGFCSGELARHIHRRIAPALDQHAAHERKANGTHICERLGAAADFLVRDENMREVTDWITATLPFDRLYFYEDTRPIHISYGPENRREAVDMIADKLGRRVPRVRKTRQ
jgi:DNA phosphorothioation-associated putative methyltransferase